jgi:hypothetical protein
VKSFHGRGCLVVPEFADPDLTFKVGEEICLIAPDGNKRLSGINSVEFLEPLIGKALDHAAAGNALFTDSNWNADVADSGRLKFNL